MAKGQKQAADKQLAKSNAVSDTALGTANSEMSSLNPFYTGEMTNPQGLGTAGVNAANTASQQALGGATAGVTGEGALMGARTRNTAGITEALDSASRGAMQTGSENATKVQLANEMLKEQQRQEGAAGKAGIFGTETNLGGQALGMGPGTLQARAAGQSWMQNNFQPFMSSLFPKGIFPSGSANPNA
jgi:hypothetical protein